MPTQVRKKTLLARVKALLALPRAERPLPRKPSPDRAPLPSSRLISEIFEAPPRSTSASSPSNKQDA